VSPRRGTATAERAGLSRAAIVDRALEVIDVDGPDAVTIRRLAQEFDVTPMALYWHVANKDELLAAMGDALLAEVTPPAADGSWSTQLRSVVESLVAALGRHPAAAHLAMPRILVCDAGRQLSETTLALLQQAGFTVQQSADLARTALQTAMMLVVQHPGKESQVAVSERAAIHAEKRRGLEALPADQYPHLRAAAGPLLDCEDDDAYFAFGIDLFIDGAEALLRRQKRASRG
jgi:TetR/AcrR family transcriptional regulator, tetracycline repressor protein